jgi:hypothetical protein
MRVTRYPLAAVRRVHSTSRNSFHLSERTSHASRPLTTIPFAQLSAPVAAQPLLPLPFPWTPRHFRRQWAHFPSCRFAVSSLVVRVGKIPLMTTQHACLTAIEIAPPR